MRDDDTTEVASRQSPSTTTSVRLFNGLGGVELGVRHTGQKAMLFVRFRKMVIAGWWKAPGAPGKSPLDLAVERAEERRAAAGVANARPEVKPGDDSEIASITTSASVSHAAGVTEIGGQAGATREQEPVRIPGRIVRGTGPAPSARAVRPETPAVRPEAVRPEAPAAGPEVPAEPGEGPNIMHRLWNRFSSPFKTGR